MRAHTEKHGNREPSALASQWPEVKHHVLLYTFHAALSLRAQHSTPRCSSLHEQRSYGRQIRPPGSSHCCHCCRVPRVLSARVGRPALFAAGTMDQRDTCTGADRRKRRLLSAHDCSDAAKGRLQPRLVSSDATLRGQSQTHWQCSSAVVATAHS
jgi:hypothetical protein